MKFKKAQKQEGSRNIYLKPERLFLNNSLVLSVFECKHCQQMTIIGEISFRENRLKWLVMGVEKNLIFSNEAVAETA